MKILILSFYYYPDLCPGSFRCAALVEQLKKIVGADIEIEIITTIPNRYSSFTVEAPELEQNEGITIRRILLPKHKSGMMDQALAFIHYAKQVRKLVKSECYSLVFATSSRLMTAVLGSWIARSKKASLYLDIRDIFVDTIADVLPKKLTLCCKPIFSFLEKWSFKKADRINLVSKGFKPYFDHRYPKGTFSFFTNGIDDEFINVIEDNSHAQLTKPITVLYAGNIGEGQGLHTIIPVLATRMQETVQFKILGDGGRRTQLETELQAQGCTNVELMPPVNRKQLIDEYQKADVLFLHLNDYDAFKKVLPSKLFEYAAMGKPVWAGLSGYSAEFVSSEISNAVIFSPCNYLEAEKVFKDLIFAYNSRDYFINKYSRKEIMCSMASDVISLVINRRLNKE